MTLVKAIQVSTHSMLYKDNRNEYMYCASITNNPLMKLSANLSLKCAHERCVLY